MSWSMAFFTFLNAWWIVLLVVLPWGMGHGAGGFGSAKSPWKQKFFITTAISMWFTMGLALLIDVIKNS